METKSWTTTDKTDWGDGPWQDEPDKMQWTDEATGLPCLAVRSRSGAWCGYVGVDTGHPWFQADPFKISLPDGVHGALNFASFCQDEADEGHGVCHIPGPGEPDRVWWLGFDCQHAWDKKPANDALMRRVAPHLEEMRQELSVGILAETYRDLDYVRDQCRRLARQARNAGDSR
jgi:hypothetical protein